MHESYYTVETLEPGKSLGYLLKRCGVLMTSFAERHFGAEPVSFTEWLVLATLSRQDQLSATTLSERIGYDMGALTRIVDGLESGGLVRRERCTHDRRAVEITLTAEGRRHQQSGKRALVALLNELVAPYTRRELETLIGLLQRMLLRLQQLDVQHTTPAGPSPRPMRRSASPRNTK